ncbi:MAG TPA: alpha/beta hydrolase, partial [Acidimicrobiales bacterium]|nr:alpha/beta hydrolase [Acidimicrobiales bacterium]
VVRIPDGRDLETAAFGDEGAPTVFFHHGTPASATTAWAELRHAADGLFVVTTSRAGYSLSSRRSGRRVADVVDDVRVALDAWGRGDYLAVGHSGGGPHALACAALDAPRCVGAFSLAGVAPTDAGFDWTEGMAQENVDEFALAMAGGPEYEAAMEGYAATFGEATADTIMGLFGGLMSEPDRAALRDPVELELFARICREAFATGHWGFYDDDRAMLSAWGFDAADIAVPVEVWYAGVDYMVPATHGRWLAARIPGARERYFESEGHMSLITNHPGELNEAMRAAAS